MPTTRQSFPEILAQYHATKAKDPVNAILLFRESDRYVVLREDARLLFCSCGIDLHGVEYFVDTDHHDGDYAIVTDGALDAVLTRIAASGRQAAVCERVGPKEAKKVDRSKIERIELPGSPSEPE